jgi:large subunit ribosomal protein L7/L12
MSAIVEELVEKIGALTLVEAAELKKALEDKFGVTAAAPVMMAAGAPAAGAAAAAEEKTEFDVELTDGGAQKLNVIKVVREVTGRRRTQARQGAAAQGRRRRAQEEARRSWRQGHAQVIQALHINPGTA